MSVILVRYCEIGLKSTPVRRRFEALLKENMLSMLVADGVEALVRYEDARYYIETDDIPKCIRSVKKVFGVGSLSVAEVCDSELSNLCNFAADYSEGRLKEGESFAVKARRKGEIRYTSMEVGKEAGSAIFLRNEHLGISVDLTDPDKTFYIEVRNNRAYVFDEYIACPGGLPMGSQGRIFAEVNDKRGLVSAWMMMKRGCRAFVTGDFEIPLLRSYDPSLRTIEADDVDSLKNIIGVVKGTSLKDIDEVDVSKYSVPVYFPTIGMNDEEVDRLYDSIKESNFENRDKMSLP